MVTRNSRPIDSFLKSLLLILFLLLHLLHLLSNLTRIIISLISKILNSLQRSRTIRSILSLLRDEDGRDRSSPSPSPSSVSSLKKLPNHLSILWVPLNLNLPTLLFSPKVWFEDRVRRREFIESLEVEGMIDDIVRVIDWIENIDGIDQVTFYDERGLLKRNRKRLIGTIGEKSRSELIIKSLKDEEKRRRREFDDDEGDEEDEEGVYRFECIYKNKTSEILHNVNKPSSSKPLTLEKEEPESEEKFKKSSSSSSLRINLIDRSQSHENLKQLSIEMIKNLRIKIKSQNLFDLNRSSKPSSSTTSSSSLNSSSLKNLKKKNLKKNYYKKKEKENDGDDGDDDESFLSLSFENIDVKSIGKKICDSSIVQPDLLIVLGGRSLRLRGYPPWQINLTEIYHVKSYSLLRSELKFESFFDALRSFSGCEQRLGV